MPSIDIGVRASVEPCADSVTGSKVAGALRTVSGGTGEGESCASYEACVDIVLAGGVPDYEGVSGSIAFDEHGDPAGAVIGVFRADRDNVFKRIG